MGIFIGNLAYSTIQEKEALYRVSMDFDTDSLTCAGAIRESIIYAIVRNVLIEIFETCVPIILNNVRVDINNSM